jgi:hypothetical protein
VEGSHGHDFELPDSIKDKGSSIRILPMVFTVFPCVSMTVVIPIPITGAIRYGSWCIYIYIKLKTKLRDVCP